MLEKMPACIYCHRQVPVARMILVTEYLAEGGALYYFCSWFHLIAWLDEKYGMGRQEARRKTGGP